MKYLVDFVRENMQRFLLLLIILQVAAIKILFVKGPAAKFASKLKCKCQNLQINHQQADIDGYLADLPVSLSRLVTLTTAAVPACDGLESSEASQITVPLRCDADWKYAKSVLQIIDGTTKEFPSDMIETEAGRTQLIDIYHALQIQDFSYTQRFVDALCVVKHAPAGISDHITYLKMWLRVFCAACEICGDCYIFGGAFYFDPYALYGTCTKCTTRSIVPDSCWLDLFSTLRKRDPKWSLNMKDISFILASQRLPHSRMYKNASSFIRAVLEFLEGGRCGLAIPYESFLDGKPLYGRFNEIVDIVRCVSGDKGLIFASSELYPFSLTEEMLEGKDNCCARYLPVCIQAMEYGRLFVGINSDSSSIYTLEFIKKVLAEVLPGQVTDLFLNISLTEANFWNVPITGATDIVSTLTTQPLVNLWIYSRNHTPQLINETEERLCALKQLNTMRNAQLTVREYRPPTESGVNNAEDSVSGRCCSCNDKSQPCFIHWWKHIEKHTRKPLYTLPEMGSIISTSKPFMLASLISTIDETPRE